VGFSRASFSTLSYFSLASLAFLTAFSAEVILAQGFSVGKNASAAAATAAASLASFVLITALATLPFFGAAAASASAST
jgi:hypothetical protein